MCDNFYADINNLFNYEYQIICIKAKKTGYNTYIRFCYFIGGGASYFLTTQNDYIYNNGNMGNITDSFVNSINPNLIQPREEVERYLYQPNKIKNLLPHLNISDTFGRPKHYNKKDMIN